METNHQQMGRYQIVKTLGRGSQGRVYLGFDPKLQRDIAIKILVSNKAEFNLKGDNGTPLEALVASKVKHPNIIPIHDIGDAELGPYLVFGYVDGRTLAVEIGQRKRYGLEEAVPLFAVILDAMKAAHDAGVLHLDLSPRNIMLDADGKPQVMDFGLSQFVNFRRVDLSMATGTLRYMAPEHFLRQQLGPFTDVFALASTFYEMITGRRAIVGSNVEEMQRKIVNVDIDMAPLDELPHSDTLKKFFRGAFVADPQERYADAGVMYEAFKILITAAGLTDILRANHGSHSTVDFLVRRMQRKKDFPAISSTLTEINRLTGDDNVAPADKLANVILRDMSLTSKLLKMANSSFYGTRATEVTNISQAVVLMGVQQIRMISSSLIMFGNMKSDSTVLKDSMTKSFFAGLLARHLARREKIRTAEEAFIAGMCQNLGENLTIYYFPEEHEDIEALRNNEGLDKNNACNTILGVNYAELGGSVAKIWALPEIIIDTISGTPDKSAAPPVNDHEKIRNLSIFTNELCDAFVSEAPEDVTEELDRIALHYQQTIQLDGDYLCKLFAAAFEKLTQFAPIFEINVAQSTFCTAISSWTEVRTREIEAQLAEAAAEEAPQKAAAN